MNMIISPLFCLIVLGTIGALSACRCGIITEPERFCYNSFAIIAKVTDSGRLKGTDRVYGIKILSTLKSMFASRMIDQRKIITSTISSLCGATLIEGKYYLLAGGYESLNIGYGKKMNIMRLSVCKIVRELKKKEIDQYEAPRCSCSVSTTKG